MSNITTLPPLPEIFVGKEVIARRIKSYLTHKHPHLSRALSGNGPKREDTRSVWYSKDHVATWLNEMQVMNADGMRVYFGAYDEEEGQAKGQLCLLMVLTRKDENGVHRDVILEEDSLSIHRFTARGGPGEDSIFGHDGAPREYNYGSPCPPICNGGPAGSFPQ